VKAYVLTDGEFDTGRFRQLDSLVGRVLEAQGFSVARRRLEPGELNFCKGCFGCWVKTPGECVIKDSMGEINRDSMQSDVVAYLVPVVFGQYSANMKNALDRWIPNILPFFAIRANGDTIHPARYETNPQMVMIGYGDGLTDEDARLFRDITTKHRDNGAVLIYDGDDEKLERELKAVRLERSGEFI
jgi:multimeric flavodoxin WrbA